MERAGTVERAGGESGWREWVERVGGVMGEWQSVWKVAEWESGWRVGEWESGWREPWSVWEWESGWRVESERVGGEWESEGAHGGRAIG